jgi:hypothetical protein
MTTRLSALGPASTGRPGGPTMEHQLALLNGHMPPAHVAMGGGVIFMPPSLFCMIKNSNH